MLLYNIYNNISNKQYFKLEGRLLVLQKGIAQIVLNKKFIPIENKTGDGIGIGFERRGGKLKGGFGISPDDNPGEITFTIGIIKTIDKKNKRFYKKEDIYSNVTLDEIEANYLSWIPTVIEVYNRLKEDDLVEFVEMAP